jgi:U3 small nucleolar RNA-associated protein 14
MLFLIDRVARLRCALLQMKRSKRSRKESKEPKAKTLGLDVLQRVEDDGDFDNRARYGRMDNYEYEMPENFEDEEIESDEAFNAQDEAMFAHVLDKSKKKKAVEEEEEEEEENLEEPDEEEGEYEDMAMQLSSSEEENEKKVDEDGGRDGLLRDLAVKLKVASGASGGRLRGLEMAQESEFGMIAPMDEEAPTLGLADVAELVATEKTRRALKRVASKTEGTSVPLGTESGKRLERKEAYKKARKDLSRWTTQVEQNRNARQIVLGDVPDKSAIVTTKVLAASFEPTTGLEKNIDSIIRESGADESNIAQFEQLEMHKLSVEEVAARAAQLAKMRSLMFYQELKDKRQSKIKSRKYRKLLKKQKEKGKMSVDELRAVDPEAADEEAEKQARERVLERVTLRHRNTSKWVKGAMRTGAMRDPGTRAAIQAQLQQHETLRRKMGVEDDEEDDEDDEDFDSAEAAKVDKQQREDEEMDDLDNPAFDPDEETPLPEPSKEAPRMTGLLMDELVIPQGHRVRASGFLSAKHHGVEVSSKSNKKEGEEEAAEADGKVEVEEAKESAIGGSELVRMSEQIARQLQPAALVEQLNTEAVPARFGRVGSDKSAKRADNKLGGAERAALVRLAFAQDDAAEAFAEEKRRLEKDEEGQAESNPDEGLAGWGAWTGEGVVAKKKKKKKKAPPAPKKKASAHPDHVYVNPKANEEQTHLKTSEIPFPFTSKEQLRIFSFFFLFFYV